MEEKIKVYFDKEYKIRVMDPAKFARSEELDTECSSFVESMLARTSVFFHVIQRSQVLMRKSMPWLKYWKRMPLESISKSLEYVYAMIIEPFLLFQAIGLRMACESEVDQRQKKKRTLMAMINEKRAELDRCGLYTCYSILTVL